MKVSCGTTKGNPDHDPDNGLGAGGSMMPDPCHFGCAPDASLKKFPDFRVETFCRRSWKLFSKNGSFLSFQGFRGRKLLP